MVISQLLSLIVRAYLGVCSRIRNLWYLALGVRIEGYCLLRAISIPRHWPQIRLQQACSLDDHVVLIVSGGEAARTTCKIDIGPQTYINRFTIIDANAQIQIGADCMIGPHCYITDGDHGTEADELVRDQSMVVSPVLIGDNVWIGAGAIILKGVKVGNSAVIAAGAVVTRDVPDHAVVAGVPATVIKARR